MSKNIVELPYKYYPDPTKGKPVYLGYIYIGEVGTDPEVLINQKQVTMSESCTCSDGSTPISQPIRTSAGGVPVFNGSPIAIFVEGNYSIKVLNDKGVQVYYSGNVRDGEPLTVDDLSTAHIFATVAAYQASSVEFPVGKTIHLDDRDADFKVIAGTGTANTFNIIASTSVSQSIDLIVDDVVNVKHFGCGFGGVDDKAAGDAAITYGVSNGVSIYFPAQSQQYTLLSAFSIINGAENIDIFSNGAKIVRDYTDASSKIFQLAACTNVGIHGFSFVGGHSAATPSLGERDIITIGDIITGPDSINSNIRIYNNKFVGGHHGCININGNFGTSNTIKNEKIYIFHNEMLDSTTGVFIYKNARDVYVSENSSRVMGQNCYGVDTLSEGDTSRPNTESCQNIVFRDNLATGGGVSAQGTGFSCKGEIEDLCIIDNIVNDIGAVSSADAMFGILISVDFVGSVGTNLTLKDNTVDNIFQDGTASWAMAVNDGWSNVKITGNTFKNAARGVKIERVSYCDILDNFFEGLATAGENPLNVGVVGSGSGSFSGYISGNTFVKDTGIATVAIVIDAGCTSAKLGRNAFTGWARGSRIFENGSASGTEFETWVKGFIYFTHDPVFLADGATELSGIVVVAEAELGDRVDITFPYDLGGAMVSAWCSANGQTKFMITNHSGGGKDLPSGTARVTVSEGILN